MLARLHVRLVYLREDGEEGLFRDQVRRFVDVIEGRTVKELWIALMVFDVFLREEW